jgi:hypothetical protein
MDIQAASLETQTSQNAVNNDIVDNTQDATMLAYLQQLADIAQRIQNPSSVNAPQAG